MIKRLSQRFSKPSLGVLIVTFIVVFCSQIFWPELPNISMSITCTLLLAMLAYWRKCTSMSVGALFGLVWSASVGYWYLHWQPQAIEFQQDVVIVGQVTAVDYVGDKARLRIDASQIGDAHYWLHRKIRLNWHRPASELAIGDKINLIAKLKPPHGLANPFGFDYERWLLANNIIAMGYVVSRHSVTVTPVQPGLRVSLIE